MVKKRCWFCGCEWSDERKACPICAQAGKVKKYEVMQCKNCRTLIEVSMNVMDEAYARAKKRKWKSAPADIISQYQDCCKKPDYIFNPWLGIISKTVETLEKAEGGS